MGAPLAVFPDQAMFDRLPTFRRRRVAPIGLLWVAAAACAQGTPVAVDAGRDLFAAQCSRCHGGDAAGTANGPDLRRRVAGMSEDAFAAAVLQRYRFGIAAADAGSESAAREAMLRGVLTRRDGAGEMPAWQSNAAVAANVKAIHAYLKTLPR